MPLHGEQRVGHSQNVGFCQKQRVFILDILVFVSLQYVFLISGSHTPSGVIGWSWEMVNASQKIPIVVEFSLLCDNISFQPIPLEKVRCIPGNIQGELYVLKFSKGVIGKSPTCHMMSMSITLLEIST